MPEPLKRALSLLTLSALLASCGGGGDPPPGKPLTLTNKTIALGTQQSLAVSQSYSGQWLVVAKPNWLNLSAVTGSGDVAFTVSANRNAGVTLSADQPSLSGVISLTWTGGTADQPQSGTASWTVNAERFTLKGRVAENLAAAGLDIASSGGLNTVSCQPARGVIVKHKSTLSAQSVNLAGRGATTLRAAGLSVPRTQAIGGRTYQHEVTDVPLALKALRADPTVEYAVPNAVLSVQSVSLAQPLLPTDQYAVLQWPFKLLGYPAVWRDMQGGAYSRAVTVAVVDSGVRFDHPDLQGRLWTSGEGALDILTEADNGDGNGVDTDPTDVGQPGTSQSEGSHGTHVTGLIVARWGENGSSCAGCSTTGVVGTSYLANVKVLPIRAIDARGLSSEADVAVAVRYAAGLPVDIAGKTYTNPHPAQVINLSLGGDVDAATARPMCEAVQDARQAGALVFAASGNGYGSVPYYPAACPAAVAVASVTLSGGSAPVHSPFSSAYPAVQLSAPGGTDVNADPGFFNGGMLNGQAFPDAVFSTSWDYRRNEPRYEGMVGTSQATPQVSALAALLLSKGATTDATSTLNRLIATATDLGAAGRDPLFGYGMINAAAALNAPAVSSTLGLRLQDASGTTYQPPLDALGRFTASLGEGTFNVVAGYDRDGNGVYGETHEPRAARSVTLSASNASVDLGDLQPK